MVKGAADTITASFGDSFLRSSDIATLGQRGWINDAVICFYFELLNSIVSEAGAVTKCHLWMTWAVSMMVELAGDSGQDVRDLLPSVKADLLLLPINDSFAHGPSDKANQGSHWSTVVVKRDAGALCVTKIESLGTMNDAAAKSVVRAFESIQGYKIRLTDEVQIAQINGWDCGIYVLVVASRLVDKALAPASQQLIDYASVTPEAVADFRTDLHRWLSKWADTLPGAKRYKSLSQVEAQIGSVPR